MAAKKLNPGFVVFSIDGVPFGLMQRMFDEGVMPHLAGLAQQNTFRQMRSIHPCVSSVAWTLPNDVRLLGTKFYARWAYLVWSQTPAGINLVLVDGLQTPPTPSKSP